MTPGVPLNTSVNYVRQSHPQVVPITIFVAVLCLCLVIGHLLEENRWVNESITAIFTGILAGAIILLISRGTSSHILTFDEELFFIYLLPPIIFNAGFQVKKKQFFHNFLTIMLFGVGGVFISSSIIAAGTWWLFPKFGFLGLTIRDYLGIGTIFSSTDTVCTLQVLHQDETPLLYSLVFGEGVVNDATSVVLFNAVQKIDVNRFNGWAVVGIFLDFFYLFSTSTCLGVAAGLLTAFILKGLYFGKHSTVREVALMILMAYLSYMLAELVVQDRIGFFWFGLFQCSLPFSFPVFGEKTGAFFIFIAELLTTSPIARASYGKPLHYIYMALDLFNLSGILTVFFSGVVMSHYAWHNVTESSRITTRHVFATMSFIAETFIFLYVGMDALDIEKWKMSKLSFWTSVGIYSILTFLILLGRAAFVFPLSFFSNFMNRRAHRSPSLTTKHQIVIWWAGLMRGAVSIALAFKQFTHAGVTLDPINATMVTTTIVVVLFSTIVFGFLTKPLVSYLLPHSESNGSIHREPRSPRENMRLPLLSFDESASTNILRAKDNLSMLIESPVYTIHSYWRRFDDAYMRPLFGGPHSTEPS